MKAVITNFGTTGDVLPLVALADALRTAGHRVTMAFSPAHRDIIRSNGFEFAAVGPDLRIAQDAVNLRWIADEAVYTSTSAMTELLVPFGTALPETYEALHALVRDADVLVSGPAQPAARMVHETTAVPFVSVQFSNFGGSGPPALQSATAALINPFRARLGLRPLDNPVTTDANSPQLALYAMSAHLLPRAPAWPPHYQVIGFLFQAHAAWMPSAALAGFLEEGPPPVVLSFGSMPHSAPERVRDIVHDAVMQTGVRAILQRREGDTAGAQVSGRVFECGFVPHQWLFARASCVVHHGGAGTAGAVFRAGAPAIYVPHGQIFDQFCWSRLSRDAGCSGDAIPIEEFTADRLAAAIRSTDGDPAMCAAARHVAERIRAENGAVAARRAIERLIAQIGLGTDLLDYGCSA